MRYRSILIGMLLAAAGRAYAAVPVVVLTGKGVQIYSCGETMGTYAWSLRGPKAVLFDTAGKPFGHHFAGPTWQAGDGSSVVGEAVATARAPRSDAVPWLVLRAKSNNGDGVFAHVTYIVRSLTSGGVAPDRGCDASHVGTETEVAYSASYSFFGH